MPAVMTLVPPPFDDRGGANCRFLGFPMLQNRFSVPAWSYLIEQEKPERIIEIGCWVGGLSCALAVAMKNYRPKDGLVFCCDIDSFGEELMFWGHVLPIEFVRMNCFSKYGVELIQKQIQTCSGICVVLCDGGNKPKEFDVFSDFLKPGDIIAAHDYSHEFWPWSEITDDHVSEACQRNNLHPFMKDVFRPAGWLIRKKK